MSLTSINPATAVILHEYEEMSTQEVADILRRAAAAHAAWKETDVSSRARLAGRLAELLLERRDECAQLITAEMGKPIRQARGEVEKCAGLCRYFAEHAPEFLAPRLVATEFSKSMVCLEPLGVVLAVMPWNFPFWQVARFAVPALLAGNGAVLKHAHNVCGCALKLEELFRQAGFPESLFRSLLLRSDRLPQLIDDPIISAVTLTGSTEAGRAIASQAGRALKKCVLELGGSDAYVVLPDADLELAAEECVTARLVNGGQSCIAAKRLIAAGGALPEFQRLVIEAFSRKVTGDPLNEMTDIGPLARDDLRATLADQIRRSVQCGAQIVYQGEVPDGSGFFFPPTVLSAVKPGMPAFDEELFGPVAAIIAARDEDEAIALANNSSFGLGAAVFTADTQRGEEVARRTLKAGSCFVNAFVRSDPRLPFGGIKASGYGRELAEWGLQEFVNVKTVVVR